MHSSPAQGTGQLLLSSFPLMGLLKLLKRIKIESRGIGIFLCTCRSAATSQLQLDSSMIKFSVLEILYMSAAMSCTAFFQSSCFSPTTSWRPDVLSV